MTHVMPPPPTGTAPLNLAQLRLAHSNATEALRTGSMAGFFGAAGTGKTYAIETWLERTQPHHGLIAASPSPGKKEIFEEIILALTGVIPTGTAVQLRRECEDLLWEQRPLLVIDEAQHLTHLWLRQLRSLYDHGQTRYSIFLVGGQGCADRLKTDPMLWKRVSIRTYFRQLTGTELIAALQQYHPLLAETPPSILATIDQRASFDGNLRDWAHFVQFATPMAERQRATKLTEKVVRATFARMGVVA